MLIRLLRSHLRPYRAQLWLIVVLQAAQAIAGLYLPRLNGHIINNGVLRGDTHYIWSTGGLMLLFTLLQVALSVTAVYWGSKVAMAFGRDVRRDYYVAEARCGARLWIYRERGATGGWFLHGVFG